MPKSFTLDGTRYKLDPLVPTGFIRWRMGQVHVATPDDEVAAEFEERCIKRNVSEPLTKQVVAYALKCHRDNQKLYNYVMK